ARHGWNVPPSSTGGPGACARDDPDRPHGEGRRGPSHRPGELRRAGRRRAPGGRAPRTADRGQEPGGRARGDAVPQRRSRLGERERRAHGDSVLRPARSDARGAPNAARGRPRPRRKEGTVTYVSPSGDRSAKAKQFAGLIGGDKRDLTAEERQLVTSEIV